MNRWAQAMVLFLLGGALVRAGTTSEYLRYVKAGARPVLLAAGIVLIATCAATLWYELRPARKGAHEDGHGDQAGHGHGHGHREPRVSWLLILPLLALALVAPPALGSYSASRVGTSLPQPIGILPLPASGPLQLDVIDYADRAVYDHGRQLGGRPIQLTGFISIGGSGTPYLTRMVLNCCAADALPVKVALSGHVPAVLRPDGWLQVTGTYSARQTRDPINNGVIPYLDVTRALPVTAPSDPYES